MTRTLNVNLDKSCFERPLLTYVSELPQADEAIKDTIYAVTTTGKWYIIDSNKTFVEVNTGSGTTTTVSQPLTSTDGSVNISNTVVSGMAYQDLSVAHNTMTTQEIHDAYYFE